MAKTVAPESMSAGIVRMVKPIMDKLSPKYGNNTEARRAEKPQTTTTESSTRSKKPSGDIPQVEKSLKDADAY